MSGTTAAPDAASCYEARGVSSSKGEVYAAIKNLDQGIFPGAFCKVLPDIFGGDPNQCVIQHADGAGTKAGLAYLYGKLTGDMTVWSGVVQDSLVMNLDDVACVGALGPFAVSMSIGRNKALIPGEVIAALIEGCQSFCDFLTGEGMPCHFAGGETADLGDLIRTVVVDNTITTRLPRSHIIDARRIRPGAVIVGLSSTGKARWEKKPNSGIGSNGLTNARHDVLGSEYRQFTETFAPETDASLIYCGQHLLDQPLPGDSRFTIGSALLSPTRTYLPFVKKLVAEVAGVDILGLIHCSGGGQTKIGKFGPRGIIYHKDRLFPVPPLFEFLRQARGLPLKEMYTSYNMGHRLEVVVSRGSAERCIEIAEDCGIEAKIVGEVRENPNPEGRQVAIVHPEGDLTYEF